MKDFIEFEVALGRIASGSYCDDTNSVLQAHREAVRLYTKMVERAEGAEEALRQLLTMLTNGHAERAIAFLKSYTRGLQ